MSIYNLVSFVGILYCLGLRVCSPQTEEMLTIE